MDLYTGLFYLRLISPQAFIGDKIEKKKKTKLTSTKAKISLCTS